jgi:hypothetical protein
MTKSINMASLVVLMMVILLTGCKAKISSEMKSEPVEKRPHPVVLQADPAWFGCKTNRDCSVERGLCNSAQAVNKAFTLQFKNYRDQMEQQLECTVDAPVVLGQQVECLSHRCALKPIKNKD